MNGRVRRWVAVNGAVMPVAVAAALVTGASWLVPAAGLSSLAGLFSIAVFAGGGGKLSVADGISALRSVGGAVAFLLALLGHYGGAVYLTVLAAAELTDFFDGRLARAYGSSEIGPNLDMDTDALFILLLSFSAYRFGGIGGWVLIPGLLRYLFVFVFIIIPPVPVEARSLSLFMKTACVAAVLTLFVANMAFLPFEARIAGAIAATAVLVVSFSWETVYYLVRRTP
jgi:phosphatidylglycerophosphate synthase